MLVVATAGHVDHGKSTLVRALTGMEPDRWAEERRRGMTIDLGFAWTELPGGATVAFVDVPGHERFIGNMLAGVGPAAAVMMVVAADEGWRAQSAEHLAAIDALQIRHGLLVVTRADLADPGPARTRAAAELRDSSLGAVRSVAVSGLTGAGLPDLREALAALGAECAAEAGGPAGSSERVRLFVDRSFTIRGAGTVVTGTLPAGMVSVGDELELLPGKVIRVRGLQSLGAARQAVAGPARIAVNLRGIAPDEIHRGATLTTPGAWAWTDLVDVRTRLDQTPLPGRLQWHVGSGAFPVVVRPLADTAARLRLPVSLPLRPGDRGILREPGTGRLYGGAEVLDVDPLPFRRRGAAAHRGSELSAIAGPPDARAEVQRRGAARVADLERAGFDPAAATGVRHAAGWLVADQTWERWTADLLNLLDERAANLPLDPQLPAEAARRALAVPDATLLTALAESAGVQSTHGRLYRPGIRPALGTAEAGLLQLETRWQEDPFAAPEAEELARLGLRAPELAAAAALDRVFRVGAGVVLPPDAPARAMRVLADLPQPFTTSQARLALGTTRRVAIPLLEHLDSRGWTKRLDGTGRIVVHR